MAQAHLSSIDMSSVDQDDPPSREEEENVKSMQLDSGKNKINN